MKFTFKLFYYIFSVSLFEIKNPIRKIVNVPVNIFVGKEIQGKYSTSVEEFAILKYVSLTNNKFKRLFILGKHFDIVNIISKGK